MEKDKLVLIIDDDEDFRTLLKKDLRDFGYKIIEASSAADGETILSMNKVSIIITDVKMPKMNGIEFYRKIKETYKMPIIFMTALLKIRETKEAHEVGLKHFITKPYDKVELSRLLDLVIERPEELDEEESIEDLYKAIVIDEIERQESFKFALFIKLSSAKFVKITHEGTHIDEQRISKLREKKIKQLYVTREDFKTYVRSKIDIAHQIEVKKDVNPEDKKKFMVKTGQLVVDKIFTEVVDEHSFNDAKEYLDITLDLISDDSDILDLLTELQSKGDQFYTHQLSVSLISVQLAKSMENNSEQTLFILGIGGIFHDIGKKFMPKEFINKTLDELPPQEAEIFKDHPINGTEILNKFHKYPSTVLQIVMQHHENCLGTGYPFQLKKQSIYPLARLIYVVDQFCHLILPYDGKPALTHKEAIEIMELNNKGELDKEYFDGLKNLFT